MQKKSENNTLFLYTALIFIVAILMILLSVFGQNNVQKQQPANSGEVVAGNGGISDNAAKLSEDNRLLLQQVRALEAELATITAERDQLSEQNAQSAQELAISETLFSAQSLLEQKKRTAARELLATIDTAALTPWQQNFYEKLSTKLK